jgi:2-methylcitrate dehydratase PrpD
VIGAAAGCARLLGLDETRTVWALGIAATQASGLREMFGSMCKSFHAGRAAQNALCAALLAGRGFTSAETALEGARGFVHVLSSSPHPEALLAGLGTQYELLQNTYKPFACGLVIHPSLDGCLQLREELGLRGPEVQRIELVVHPLALELTGKPAPRTGLEAKFSIYHAAAAAILDGAGGEAQFSDARANAPDAIALRAKVHVRADPSLRKEEAHVSIAGADGSRHAVHVADCVGSLQRPLTDAALDAKFLGLARPALGPRAAQALAALRALAQARDAAAVARGCAAITHSTKEQASS